ncbi:hypothetical protein ACFIJ5_05640 [Haloimpatiens sp. FM7330]|uniref:hypothetical protein n=1 Tax=Haloimpatiens sp. FM7330 TaxID=3298610 RepID=UPI0036378C00
MAEKVKIVKTMSLRLDEDTNKYLNELVEFYKKQNPYGVFDITLNGIIRLAIKELHNTVVKEDIGD